MSSTLEELIFEQWRRTILGIEDHQIDMGSAQGLIDATRKILREAGCSPVDEHTVMLRVRNALVALTDGHPICGQFIRILNSQLETN